MMHKRVLFCATVDLHFKAFHLPYLKWFKEQGWEVHAAANGELDLPYVDKKYSLDIQRSPFHPMNLRALQQLKYIIDHNQYNLIHCHTPMGGVLTRLAARKARSLGTKLIYTAHGFHFCKGAPLINWLLYYPIEKLLSPATDCLITINEEDFQLAQTYRFRSKQIMHVHGVGVDTKKYSPVNQGIKEVLRREQGYREEDFLLFYAAEFNENKNQQFLIDALSYIKEELPHVKLLLAGDGPLQDLCKKQAEKMGVARQVHFLGYRDDIANLLKISDLAVASSYREGLPVNIMEAMASGLPVVASNNRGHRELIQNEKNGWLVELNSATSLAEKIAILANNQDLNNRFGQFSRRKIEETYALDRVLLEQQTIYSSYMEEMEGLRWAVH